MMQRGRNTGSVGVVGPLAGFRQGGDIICLVLEEMAQGHVDLGCGQLETGSPYDQGRGSATLPMSQLAKASTGAQGGENSSPLPTMLQKTLASS